MTLYNIHVHVYSTNEFASDADDMLSLPILDHIESLKSTDDILSCDTGQVTATYT